MKDFSGVYLIQCMISGKGYIGCSANVMSRLKTHKTDLKCGRHINIALQRAWNKYGAESFQYTILLKTDDIFTEEKRLIALHQTFGKGYNLTPGGEGIGADSPDVCAKRQATFKANYSEETKQLKSVLAKQQFANMSQEAKSAFAKKGSEAAKAKMQSLTDEEAAKRSLELAEYSNRRWAKLSKEERSKQNQALWMNKSAEEKRLIAMKSWETRRKNKEALND